MKTSSDLLHFSPARFIGFLKTENIRRFYLALDEHSGRLIPSHPQLQVLADYFSDDKRDFMQHEGLFVQLSRKYDTLLGAFIHRTRRGQAAGGVRYWTYDSMEDYFRDGLRLAKGMGRKNALAGLWWGGGKGVMARNPAVDKNNPQIRAELYREYGEFMTSLQGCYVTAEDVGTSVEDMAHIFSKTRFTTCIPPELGGSGNPSIPTARGVVRGMEAALKFTGSGTLEGKTIAVQGMGHVAEPLIGFLFEKGAGKVIACDIDPRLVENVGANFAEQNFEARVVKRHDLSFLSTPCDILAPCATGAILNPRTIPTIKAKIVCGAANNQLEDAVRDGRLIHEQGVVYVPDFLANRMGIVNCANEQYGYINHDPLIEQHLSENWEYSVYQTTLRVLAESKEKDEPTAAVAVRQADELAQQEHPLFGHRGFRIIQSLVENRWQDQ